MGLSVGGRFGHIGTHSSGVRLGPFSMSTGYGHGRRRRSSGGGSRPESGPTKTELREQAVHDLRELFSSYPAAAERFGEQAATAARKGDYGAAAEAGVRYVVRLVGAAKEVFPSISREARTDRDRWKSRYAKAREDADRAAVVAHKQAEQAERRARKAAKKRAAKEVHVERHVAEEVKLPHSPRARPAAAWTMAAARSTVSAVRNANWTSERPPIDWSAPDPAARCGETS